ncbi:hypothetical protein NDU88_004965 [Pleurodeles waltl]|uniref:Uncharacterized protein n=1 Tax=Pleurodeles waltl TaxID=8319 RepID=A0AAV7WA49_PLEWA|nr:hypothetical protein NDU88_004965 [Pleurodeles waltl]
MLYCSAVRSAEPVVSALRPPFCPLMQPSLRHTPEGAQIQCKRWPPSGCIFFQAYAVAQPRHLTVPAAVVPDASILDRAHSAPPLFHLPPSLPLRPGHLFLLTCPGTVLVVIRGSARLTS